MCERWFELFHCEGRKSCSRIWHPSDTIPGSWEMRNSRCVCRRCESWPCSLHSAPVARLLANPAQSLSEKFYFMNLNGIKVDMMIKNLLWIDIEWGSRGNGSWTALRRACPSPVEALSWIAPAQNCLPIWSASACRTRWCNCKSRSFDSPGCSCHCCYFG